MARYATTVRSERPASVAFAFVADLSNLPQWDPGVQKVSQIRGDGLGAEAAYEVVLSSAGNTRLVYEMTDLAPRRPTRWCCRVRATPDSSTK